MLDLINKSTFDVNTLFNNNSDVNVEQSKF